MKSDINVSIVKVRRASGGRLKGYWYMRYHDPVTGKQITKSTGCEKKRDAERAAGAWENELRNGTYKAPSKTTWKDFRDQADSDYLPAMSKRGGDSVTTALDSFGRFALPRLMSGIDTATITRWQNSLRQAGLAEATIRCYSATLKAALGWGATHGLLTEVPEINMPKRAKLSDRRTPMKGRAVTPAEFERMLKAVSAVVDTDAVKSWETLLRGVWLSGLRLSEALSLSWDNEDELRVDIADDGYVMLAIPSEKQKNNRDELLPIAPEFRDFLLEVPHDERTGHVFPLLWRRTPRAGSGRRVDTVGKTVTAIGQAADVVVSVKSGKTKYASAHDLRRSFGDRWAARVPSLTLKTLMRHESIETTERYYVSRNARTVIDELEAFAT